jgi:hypothetical protein
MVTETPATPPLGTPGGGQDQKVAGLNRIQVAGLARNGVVGFNRIDRTDSAEFCKHHKQIKNFSKKQNCKNP